MAVSEEEMKRGKAMIESFLKKVEISTSGTLVKIVQWYDFPTEEIARSFADGMKKTFGGQ